MKIIKDILTCPDNQTYDFGKVMGALIIVIYLGLILFEAVYMKSWHSQEFGVNLGLVMTAIGVLMRLKTEPGEK
jgi:uncharacterized membrane protein YczE